MCRTILKCLYCKNVCFTVPVLVRFYFGHNSHIACIRESSNDALFKTISIRNDTKIMQLFVRSTGKNGAIAFIVEKWTCCLDNRSYLTNINLCACESLLKTTTLSRLHSVSICS